jgi:phospholipid/cholesterol/gamma-HCH transport system ATP-binding protein
MEAIGLYGIDFSFKKNHYLLQGANLSVQQGEILCICGTSGQGKSSLLRILAGLEKPDSGQILYNGVESSPEEHSALNIAHRKVAYLLQNSALINNLNVRDNVALPMRYHQVCSEPEIIEKVNRVLSSMLVSEFADEFPFQLSMGIRKRVALARALIMDPTILLMDEPTSGLDNVNRRLLLTLIDNLKELQNTTILIVTHDLLIAKELKIKICFLHKGLLTHPHYFEQLLTSDYDFVQEMLQEVINRVRK